MRVTQRVKKLLSQYEGDNPGTKTALARILMEGKLAGTGRALILPIDHAFSKTMVPKFSGADPDYHFQLAIDAGLSALAAPLGMLETAADAFAGSIPLILQMHAGDPFSGEDDTPVGSLRDALRLGCVGISCAITPDHGDHPHTVALVEEAKSYGLAVMMWASAGSSADIAESGLDAVSKAAHTASLMGAHLVCVRVPGKQAEASKAEPVRSLVTAPLSDRIRQVRQSCSNGRRIVVFAGTNMESDDEVFEDIRGIRDGGGHGYVLPPNSLYRPYDPALQILDKSLRIYQGKA